MSNVACFPFKYVQAWLDWIPSRFSRYLPVSAVHIHCCASSHAAKSQLKCSFNSPTWPFSSGLFETCAPTWATLSDLLVAFNRLLIHTLPYTHSHTHIYSQLLTQIHTLTHCRRPRTNWLPRRRVRNLAYNFHTMHRHASNAQLPFVPHSPPHYCISDVFFLFLPHALPLFYAAHANAVSVKICIQTAAVTEATTPPLPPLPSRPNSLPAGLLAAARRGAIQVQICWHAALEY